MHAAEAQRRCILPASAYLLCDGQYGLPGIRLFAVNAGILHLLSTISLAPGHLCGL